MSRLRCAAPDREPGLRFRRRSGLRIALLGLLSGLAACHSSPRGARPDNSVDQPQPVEKESEPDLRLASLPGTPMADRVAVIGLLNKRNGDTRKLTMKPGQALRVGNVIVRLRACETSAPWEEVPETGAFVQVDVKNSADMKWHRVFSGWLFKERPDRNVVQDPIYDVWVMSCAMTWPESGADTVRVVKGPATNAAAPDMASPDQSGAAAPASPSNASKAPGPPANASASKPE